MAHQIIGQGDTLTLDAVFQLSTGALVDAEPVRIDVIDPDSVQVVTDGIPVHDSTGRYHYDYAVGVGATLGVWQAHWTGSINSVAVSGDDLFEVVSAGAITFPSDSLYSGTCASWANSADLPASCDPAPGDANVYLQAASDILYNLSGRQFSGSCTASIRPSGSRPGGPTPYWTYSLSNDRSCGCFYGNCDCDPIAQISLSPYPVNSILSVKIDGSTVNPATYRLDDYRHLVRTRTSPTQQKGSGWPCCQALDLPTTEVGTFEITYTYGLAPPEAGVLAAAQLACQLIKAASSDSSCALPPNIQQLTRQGVSILLSSLDDIKGGLTGLGGIVDLFITTYNKTGLTMPSVVWSPDTRTYYRRAGT